MVTERYLDKREYDLVVALDTIRSQKRALEKAEESIVSELKPLVADKFKLVVTEEGKAPVLISTFGALGLSQISMVNRSISRDKLLERGVDPSIVLYATTITNFHQYRIVQPKHPKETKP